MSSPEFLRFTGHKSFTKRLVLSALTGRPVHISKIRSASPTNPGLAPHEVSFLRLLEAVTNGSSTEISYTGTAITYRPGLIVGSDNDDVVEHVLPASCAARGLTYFLLPLALLAPFSKGRVNVRLCGPGAVTAATAAGDPSVDTFRTAVLPLYGLFGIPPARVELRVLARSCASRHSFSGGAVELRSAAQVRLPATLHLNRRPGRVRRIRGVAYCTGVAASNNGRMIHAAREVLNPLVPDIHVAAQYDPAPRVPADPTSTASTRRKRPAIGFGLSLVAESSTAGVLYSADEVAPPQGGAVPEDVGRRCALQLLESVSQGGCVGALASSTVLLLMAMGSEDVGRLRIGRDVVGREETLTLARDLKQFGASSWGLRDVDDDETTDVLVSVRGMGVGNVGRKIA